jgi:hypothetical protein
MFSAVTEINQSGHVADFKLFSHELTVILLLK